MDRAKFFDGIRPMFKGGLQKQQVEWIEAILDKFSTFPVTLEQAAYILATAQHETDHFKTLEEYASGAAYGGRKDLGNTVKGDGRKFKGRGFVQITGRRNYAYWAKRLGVDLLKEPARAMEVNFARVILIEGMMHGTFTGKKLPDYVNAGGVDYKGARRVVNGTDKAALIAGYAVKYEAALRAADFGKPATVVVVQQPPAEPVVIAPAGDPPNVTVEQPKHEKKHTGLMAVGAILASLIAGLIQYFGG